MEKIQEKCLKKENKRLREINVPTVTKLVIMKSISRAHPTAQHSHSAAWVPRAIGPSGPSLELQ